MKSSFYTANNFITITTLDDLKLGHLHFVANVFDPADSYSFERSFAYDNAGNIFIIASETHHWYERTSLGVFRHHIGSEYDEECKLVLSSEKYVTNDFGDLMEI